MVLDDDRSLTGSTDQPLQAAREGGAERDAAATPSTNPGPRAAGKGVSLGGRSAAAPRPRPAKRGSPSTLSPPG